MEGGIRIVVTFTYLRHDVEMVKCGNDVVEAIVPPTVDPHEYELTPTDVEKLLKADLIISTKHAHFELEIEEIVKTGEIKAELLEIPSVEGMKFLENPATGLINIHEIIYDPDNYLAYMEALVNKLKELNPSHSSVYEAKLKDVISKVEDIKKKAPKLNVTALATTPIVQYAVEWMGIKVKYLILKESDVPASPHELMIIDDVARRGGIGLVVTVESEREEVNEKAEEIARAYNIPVVKVPSPIFTEGMLKAIEMTVDRLKEEAVPPTPPATLPLTPLLASLALMAVALIVALFFIIKR